MNNNQIHTGRTGSCLASYKFFFIHLTPIPSSGNMVITCRFDTICNDNDNDTDNSTKCAVTRDTHAPRDHMLLCPTRRHWSPAALQLYLWNCLTFSISSQLPM